MKTGVQRIFNYLTRLDSGLRRNDGKQHFQTFYEIIIYFKLLIFLKAIACFIPAGFSHFLNVVGKVKEPGENSCGLGLLQVFPWGISRRHGVNFHLSIFGGLDVDHGIADKDGNIFF